VQQLSAVDAAFVYLETATNHMHMALVAVFDPTTMVDGYSFARIRALVQARLSLVPPFRRRLREVPFRLGRPVWVDDPEFDLDDHLHRVALPAPGGDAELAELAADVFGRGLRRRHPLWEMQVVEGLQGGMFAVITKVHHAAIDGVSGTALLARLLDISAHPAATPRVDGAWQPEPQPSDLELVAVAARDLAGRIGPAVRSVGRVAEAWDQGRSSVLTVPVSVFPAPRTAFNVSITPERRFASVEVSLDDIKTIKNLAGGTVNDVALALCAGGLRRYLSGKGTLPAEPMVALVPMSVRPDGESFSFGNQVSALLISMPTHLADPRRRLSAVVAATGVAKSQDPVIDVETLTQWADLLGPAVAAKAARALMSAAVVEHFGPLFNVVVSNVRGPDFPMYLAGARLVRLWPMGPVADGAALNLTAMSYLGRLHFGLVSCPEAVPDLAELAESIHAEVAVLLAAAGGRPARGSSPQVTTGARPFDGGAPPSGPRTAQSSASRP
jgi:WS/DGAT/MGAT family acyltransferase